MFRASDGQRILSQVDHSLFAGWLAWHCGNAHFEKPALNHATFARGLAARYAHPVTDVVAKMHLRRLIGTPSDADTQRLAATLDGHIARRAAESGHSCTDFIWADHITDFCDSVAFHLGFSQPDTQRQTVGVRQGDAADTHIEYQIRPDGVIRFSPWPFGPREITMPAMFYAMAGYPDTPVPDLRFIRCVSA